MMGLSGFSIHRTVYLSGRRFFEGMAFACDGEMRRWGIYEAQINWPAGSLDGAVA